MTGGGYPKAVEPAERSYSAVAGVALVLGALALLLSGVAIGRLWAHASAIDRIEDQLLDARGRLSTLERRADTIDERIQQATDAAAMAEALIRRAEREREVPR